MVGLKVEIIVDGNNLGPLSNWLAHLTVNQAPLDVGVRIPLGPLTEDCY